MEVEGVCLFTKISCFTSNKFYLHSFNLHSKKNNLITLCKYFLFLQVKLDEDEDEDDEDKEKVY